ncbi:hypothetical protein N0V90_006634 [Kalmusia sp. IMI 367209]|nr:hypothetical protein N0V90_006634 [Kalmusia sp. IMI 367209]
MGIQSLIVIFWSLLGPWQYLAIAISYLPRALARLLQDEPLQSLSISRIQNAWFSAFWARAGTGIRQRNGPRVTALLEGRVSKAQVVDTTLVAPAGGIVLDIGPGSGIWVDLYAKYMAREGNDKAGSTSNLKVYGVEPNKEAHAELLTRVHQAGLDGTYEIVPAGIQSISSIEVSGIDGRTSKIEKGSVDCIVSLLCLCSIPEPEKNIAELYKYLKKGGRWYVFEHVQAKSNWFMRFYQEKTLRQAGPWESVDLGQPLEELWHATVPHVLGTLTK